MRASAFGLMGAFSLALAIGCDGAGALLMPRGEGIVVSVSPVNAVVPPAGSADFLATVTEVASGTTDAIHWSLSGAGCSGEDCGTLVELGPHAVRFTAPPLAPIPATVVIQAISDMPAGNFDASFVTVGTVPISVRIDPDVTSVSNCGSIPLTATVTADVAQAGVSWSVEGNLCDVGSCGATFPDTTASSAAVTYAGPCSAALPSGASVRIRATSLSDPSRSATASVSLTR